MALVLSHEAANIYRMDVSGELQQTDLEHGQALLADAIQQHGSIRLLVVIGQFTGWASGGPSDDMDFYLSYGASIDRIAIVGHDRWREPMLMFVAAGLRRAPVEFFVRGAISQARAWLADRPTLVRETEERAGPYGKS
jgi:hypothetical protein